MSNVANIQASMYKAFAHVETLPWVALAYGLTITATIPLVRRMLNLGNIRITVAIFFVIFIVSCAISGSANSMVAVVVGRVLTGVGSGGVFQMFVSLLFRLA